MRSMAAGIKIFVRDMASGPIAKIRKGFVSMAGESRRAVLGDVGNLALAGQAAADLGRSMRQAISAPVMASARFDDALATVRSVMRGTKEETLLLRSAAESLGESTRFSAIEAAQGMQYFAMAGFKANETIEAMPHALNLASASGVGLGRTADILSDIADGFGMGKDSASMQRVANGLTAGFTRSNTTLEGLGQTFKYISSQAGTLNIPFEELVAMTGMLGSAGVKGEQAGTALRGIMGRLAAPTKEASGALKSLGIKVADAHGNMRPMVSIIGDLQATMSKFGTAQQMNLSKLLFGDEASSAALRLLSLGPEKIRAFDAEIRAAISGNEAAKIAQIREDTLMGDMRTFGSAWEAISITLGDSIKPELRDLTKTLTGLIREFGAWAKANHDTIKPMMKFAAMTAVVVTAIGGLALVAGTAKLAMLALAGPAVWLAKPLLLLSIPLRMLAGSLLVKAVAGLGWLATAFRAVSMVALANPIGLVVAAVAALGAAAWYVYNNWEAVKGKLLGIWDGFKSIKLFPDWKSEMGGAEALFAYVGELSHNMVMFIPRQIANIFNNIFGEMLAPLRQHVANMTKTVVGWMPDWLQKKMGFDATLQVASQPINTTPPKPIMDRAGGSAAALGAAGQQRVDGRIQVEITQQGRARVRQVESSGPVDIGLDLAMEMAP
ncbi:phage tail tape measure protein [Magnetococcus sp. PR-3]|uniref:phage tail tape measure protein n=1 Tax=Magnetococcus sp. PR-3 TaxID=3120355 RepID=UPI002FCE43FF